jgi:transposase
MSIRNIAPTAGAEISAIIFVAIEMSRSRWDIVIHTPVSDKLSRYCLEAGNGAGLIEFIDSVRSRVAARLGHAVRVVSCYEAGYDGFWLDRLLRAHGIENHIIDPSSIEVNRRARRAKTDRLDAEGLVRTLIRWWGGDRQACHMVHVPSVSEEDAKRPSRERERLVKERIQHVNRIKGLLATQGLYDFHPLHPDREAQLARLALPGHLRAELQRDFARLALILEQISVLEAARDAVVKSPAAPEDPAAAKICKLFALKSLGPQFSTTFVREVYYRDFANRRQVGSYFGLTGSPWRSGRLAREQGISKAGNPRARTLMIEAAWAWLRYQPDSALARWFRERVGHQTGRVRRIAIVALARKLAVALWRYLEHDILPEGAVTKS